ncbi:MAG: hypothetical protein H6Q52_1717 [Deltaproteobacteria bacterium]|nr:hypothetical protein [Deltaproteobacteria bacterium]
MRHRGLSNWKLFVLLSILFVFLPCIALASVAFDLGGWTPYFPRGPVTMGGTFTFQSGDSLTIDDADGLSNYATVINNGGSIANRNNSSFFQYLFVTNNAGGTITNTLGSTFLNEGSLPTMALSPTTRTVSSGTTAHSTSKEPSPIPAFSPAPAPSQAT